MKSPSTSKSGKAWLKKLFNVFLYSLPIIIPLSMVYTPIFWVNICMLVDFYTPWVLFESPMYEKYHNFLISRLDERPEMPLIEIPAEEASFDKIAKLTKGFTWF